MTDDFQNMLRDIGNEYRDVLWRLNDSKIIHVSLDEVIEINKYVHNVGSGRFGIRDRNLLESAVMSVQQAEVYAPQKSVEDLGLVLMSHLIKNHPFIDGNKRTGTMAFLVFCRLNGVLRQFDHDDLVKTAETLAIEKLAETAGISHDRDSR